MVDAVLLGSLRVVAEVPTTWFVMMVAAALLAVGAACGVGLGWWRDRRRTASRLSGAADHIDALTVHEGAPDAGDESGPVSDPELAWHQVASAIDRAREAVRSSDASRQRIERALGAIPEGVVLVDERGEVVFRNEVAAEFEAARHGDALVEAAVRELIAAAVAGGITGERTLELFGPPRRTMVISAQPLLTEGHPVGALALVEDITDRRRLEAVRRDFVANISHELRTPVGALSLLAETLLEEEDPAVNRRLAGRMVNEAIRLANTIEDLLVLSRIESEEAPEREPVPIHLVVAEALGRIRPAAEQAGIEINVAEPDPNLAVMADRRQLVSAVYNLLDNAVKYSDAGSTIDLAASTDGRLVNLSVADHGIGIPARDLERVFERFYRVDVARSRQTGGTGLGLSIVRHVVANHDGEVTVESRLGEGSTFTLRLPLTATGPVAVALPPEPEPAPHEARDAG